MTGSATDVTEVPTELRVDAVQKRAKLWARSTSPRPGSWLVMAPWKQTRRRHGHLAGTPEGSEKRRRLRPRG
jgi:hypothetical protein